MESQGDTPNPPPPRRRPGITTLTEVRQAMARILRRLEKSVAKKEMPADVARALIYGYAELARVMKDLTADELLRRMEALEQRQARAEEQAGAH